MVDPVRPGASRERVPRVAPSIRPPRSMRHRAIAGSSCASIPVVAMLLVLGACKGDPPRPQRPTPVVSADTVRKGALPYVVTASGEVEANRSVAVQSLVSGMLVRVAFAEGDEVQQGQVLFEIDPRPFRAELQRVQSTLARDEATLTRARGDSVRYAGLAKDGYVTRQQLDQAFADASALAATVAADRAQLEAARLNLDNTTIRAPISGRTGQLAIKAGNLVRAQTEPALVSINEVRPVLVRFSVPERDFEEMRRRSGLDKPLNVVIRPNVGDTARRVNAELTFVDNVVDRATGSVLLKARAANQGRELWPGQFVNVGLELSVDADAVTVPTTALITTPNGSFVYVINEGKAKRSPVRTGRVEGVRTKIDSGLTGGERIVVEGQQRLSDGARIEVRGDAAPGGGGPGGANGGNGRRRGDQRGRQANAGAGGAGGAGDAGGGADTNAKGGARRPGGNPQ